MSKIYQIHFRVAMLCMSEMLKMGKEHTHTFLLITSLMQGADTIALEDTPPCPTAHVHKQGCLYGCTVGLYK